MIEKLKEHDVIDPKTDKIIGTIGCDLREIMDKLNEVIDAVNELQTAKDVMFNRIDRLNDAMCDMRIATKNMQPDAETRPENVQDKFAEQRKWVGKLCKFWDIDNNNLYYGPLTKIHDTSPYCYECNHKMCYANCEPVKDDVIYKGK